MNSPMPAINTETAHRLSVIRRGEKLARTLSKVTDVPSELADACDFASFKYETGERSKAARTLLTQARTEADMKAALDELAEALVIEHTAAETMRNVVVREQYDRVMTALRIGEYDIFATLAEKFNELAAEFDAAARQLPDLTAKMSAFGFSPDQTAALHESKRLKDALDEFYRPYVDLASLVHPGLSDTRMTVYLLGKVENHAVVGDAVQILEGTGTDNGKTYGPVLPYYALAASGIELNLSAHPSDAENDREAVHGHLFDQMR